MAKDITSNANGFKTSEYSLSALPLLPYIKITGFASDGISWDDIDLSNDILGADGLKVNNTRPVLYVGTFSLLPNSPVRNALDLLITSITPVFGKQLNTAGIELVETNNLTGYKYIYTNGNIISTNGGNNNNMNDGQGVKTYKISFGNKVMI